MEGFWVTQEADDTQERGSLFKAWWVVPGRCRAESEFSHGMPQPSVKRARGSFCIYTVHLEKFGEPESSADLEADNLNRSPAVPETPSVAVGKFLLLSRICKQGAGCSES